MSLRRRASALLGLSIAVAGVQSFTLPTAQAVSANIVISEVYGAGGNGTNPTYTADFIELYNPTSAAVDVSTWSLQYRSASGTSVGASNITNLTGSIPAKSYYLVKEADGTATGTATLPTPDVTGTIALGGATGQVLLVSNQAASTVGTGDLAGNASLVDMVGYGAAGSYEGKATTTLLTNVTSAQRADGAADTDNNDTDFSEAVPAPQRSSNGGATTGVAVANPGAKTATVGTAITPFTVTASGGTSPYTYASTTLPAGLSISSAGQVTGTPTTATTTTTTVTATDSATPTPGTASTSFTYTVSAAPTTVTPIAAIQGDNTDTSPLAGSTVTTRGVVTAAFPTGGLNGFYLQTGGPDTTPNASDGLFVFAGTTVPAGSYPAVGSTVDVTGAVSEYFGLTEFSISGPASVVASATPQAPVVPGTVIPGTDCALPGTDCLTGAALTAAKELHEGELFKPAGDYTVTDVYDGSPAPSTASTFFGEIGLAANSTRALVAPTELFDTQTQAAQLTARTNYNNAHRVILDDGSSTNYTTTTDAALPWFTADHYVRNNAPVTFPQPVVMTYANNDYKLEPSGGQVVGDSTGKVDFGQNRPAAPGAVGGAIKLATANVLNYFPTTGQEFVSSGLGTCTYFNDRQGNPISDNSCNPNGPRGAATAASLKRQQDKIVKEINSLDASIVSLEEIENSIFFGKNRDFALSTLVAALNADAGSTRWAFAPSPAAADLPAQAEQDVIRTAFIYNPATISLVGASKVLVGSAPFSNAREPLAQGFKAIGRPNSEAFAVIVNHFKSKGSGTDDGTGQGNANPDRIAQANALKAFADSFTTQLQGSGATFLTGDFNAYTQEDPVQVLTDAGYTQLESTTTAGEESYNFGGLDGSLDHVFANPTANALVTGVDIWNINADETVYYEYSRFNSNVTNLYVPGPFRASDHNPELIGFRAPAAGPAVSAVAVPTTTIAQGTTPTTVTATVTSNTGTPTGTVTISGAGLTPVTATVGATGTASLALATGSLAIGSYTLNVAYSGGGTAPAASSTFTLVVKRASTVAVANTTVVAGSTKDVTVTVSGSGAAPTGTVTVSGAGAPVTATLTPGSTSSTATLTLATAALTPGTYTATATYGGDGTYVSSTRTFTVTVTVAPFNLNLLNINDFHGRIDGAITTRLATTIEQLRKAGGEDNTLLLSAGDNIGASLFPSSTQRDDPTIDVLNALDVRASAVGNHEFDQGFSDLTGHVAGRSNFKYLGANVYLKGTTTPALQEYRIFNVKGVKIGVIGAVTQETASLVSPAGITNLDFGDPVDAVNRVAAQLSDGDTSNGEADVLVAEYHEGAPAGDAEVPPATLASNLAASPVFTKIVEKTSPLVNAIFTAHTHKRYAYDAPAPAGSDTATRPVVQTGNYGDFVGQVTLSINPTTGAVTAHTEKNVARSATEDLTFPRVAEVKRITDAALAVAATVGNQKVGNVTADITTAFIGGTYGADGKYTVPDPKSTTTRDNRVAESTLGDTVANALRDGVSQFATPDLGVTNPGGLRAELLYAGDPAANPVNTDGVVTFAEANAVLPFNNTVAIVKLTGAQLKTVLEQQYQTNTDGTVPTRAYLQLGLSDNVRVVSDPSAAAGSRITSVYINDVALDPAKVYTVSTLSFLGVGGDNFRAFNPNFPAAPPASSYVDTGLLDAQLFRDFLGATPRSPDFARQQVFANGLPSALTVGQPSTFTLGVTNPTLAATTPGTLNMTSLGSPANTSVVATIGTTNVGTFPVTNGTAAITLTVPSTYTSAGEVTLTAVPSGTKVTVPFVPAGGTTPPTTPPTTTPTPPTTTPTPPAAAPVSTQVDATVKPATLVAGRTKAKVKVRVVGADGKVVTGVVTIKVKGGKTKTVTLVDGKAKVGLGRFAKPGLYTVTVKYAGTATSAPSSSSTTVQVKRR